MHSPLEKALAAHSSLTIVGMSKNAGKTTVLNRLLALLRNDPRTPAVTSIGRDGEAVDIVTGTEKPGVWVRAGTLVATAADMLRFCDATREILDATGVNTPLGEVIVFRALSDGFVQLAGPSMTAQMAALGAVLRRFGAGIVLIDGAVGRRSLAAPEVGEATILCAGASYAPDMGTVIADTAYACALLTLPVTHGHHAHRHALPGAATDAAVRALGAKPGDEITVLDGSRMLISHTLFESLRARGICFTVERPVALCCVCVNPHAVSGADFDAHAFLSGMAKAVPVPVLNVKEPPDD